MSEFISINPATEEICGRYTKMSQSELESVIEKTKTAQIQWAHTDIATRKNLFIKIIELLNERKEEFAKIITTEMGKPISQSISEIEKCAKLCEYYIDVAEKFLAPQVVKTEYYRSFRAFEPLGLIFAIMPWNFPFWQVMRFTVPNLMAGNATLLKHAPNSLGAAMAIEKMFLDAGFPDNVFRSLIIDVDLAPVVIHHPKVAGVTLTGSNRAGKSVAKEAGDALKKVVLELGGSDPYVILEDADVERAANESVRSRLNNCGQVCIAAKRIIVVDKIRKDFEALVLEKTKQYVMGNPENPKTNLGPMARKDLREKIHYQVQRTIASGARCVLGGTLPDTKGFFYPATVLLDVNEKSPAFHEELFGPVICVISAKDEAEALALANKSDFGLAGAVFTQDLEKGERLAQSTIAAGTCAVNSLVSSDPRLPFGGIKQSGFGRELSVEGLHAFMNIKTIIVAK